MTREWTLRARWVFPVSSAPLEQGTVTVAGDRVVAVGQASRRADIELGNVAVVPGLVNAHTHLDLTGLRGMAAPSPDFPAWLRQVVQFRRARPPEQVRGDIHAGLAECIAHGTTLVGDISSGGASWDQLVAAPMRAVVFCEMLGLTQERAEQALAGAQQWLRARARTPACRPGLSPHAPYSVRTSLFHQAATLAAEHCCPLAIHLAESAVEVELLRDQQGPFVPFLANLGVWDAGGLASGLEEVLRACVADVPKLFIHANHLSPATPLPPQSSIIYCPRTHAAFGHPPHPWRDLLARGVRVALGTDSLASNPDLDLLAEARFLHRHFPEVPGVVLLRMATLWGAEALGWGNETGSLEPGKSADLAVIELPSSEGTDPYRLLLGEGGAVRRVLYRGHWVKR